MVSDAPSVEPGVSEREDLTISAIIPVYNGAATIARALDSVCAQTYNNVVEIIVVDDGSTDDTAQLVHDRYPCVALVRQANAGVSTARNVGVTRAAGELIAFLDADDEWLPTKLEEQVRLAVAYPDSVLLLCQEITVPVDGPPQRRAEGEVAHFTSRDWLHGQPLAAGVSLSCSGWLFRRVEFQRLGGFDESLHNCEDFELALRASERGPTTAAVLRGLFVRHMQERSVSQGPRSVVKRAEMACHVVRRYDPRGTENGQALLSADEYESILQYYLLHLLYNFLLEGSHAEAAEVAQETASLRGRALRGVLAGLAARCPRLAGTAVRRMVSPVRELLRGRSA